MLNPKLKRLRVGLRRMASIAAGTEFSRRDPITKALVAFHRWEVGR